MKVKITTVVENTVTTSRGLLAEHGLSFLVESGDRKTLFDTGQGMALLNNLSALGYNAGDIGAVVLSHGHYDHAGGVKGLIAEGARFDLFAHPDVFSDKCAMYPGKGIMPIGFSLTREDIEAKGIGVELSRSAVEIAPGITSTGEIPMRNDFEKIEPILLVGKDGEILQDPLADDQALILDTEKGIVLLLGCTHRGIVNTLEHVASLTGGKPVHAIIGGLHLERAPDAQIEKTIAALRQYDLKMIGFAHCTGFRAGVALINAFGGKAFPCPVNTIMNF